MRITWRLVQAPPRDRGRRAGEAVCGVYRQGGPISSRAGSDKKRARDAELSARLASLRTITPTAVEERSGAAAVNGEGEASEGSAASEVVWVYAVTADLDTDQISGLTGVAPRIGAVVGSVDDAVFGEESLTSLLTDLTSVETVG